MKNQSGQIVIILLLIIVISLAIGLSIASRSVSEIAISTKTEQSQRAFSAAEGAMERALKKSTTGSLTPGTEVRVEFVENQSLATAKISSQLPFPGQPLEYPYPPGIGKADFAHFWLANPDTLDAYYNPAGPNKKVKIYFGNPTDSPDFEEDNKPAIEVSVITRLSTGEYKNYKYLLDIDSIRSGGPKGNNFKNPPAGTCNNVEVDISSSSLAAESEKKRFLCGFEVPTSDYPAISDTETLILARVRILYSDKKQRLAVGPINASFSLPPQTKILKSTGTSGQLQRKLQLFSTSKVVPPFLDYAIFSTGVIDKSQ